MRTTARWCATDYLCVLTLRKMQLLMELMKRTEKLTEEWKTLLSIREKNNRGLATRTVVKVGQPYECPYRSYLKSCYFCRPDCAGNKSDFVYSRSVMW